MNKMRTVSSLLPQPPSCTWLITEASDLLPVAICRLENWRCWPELAGKCRRYSTSYKALGAVLPGAHFQSPSGPFVLNKALLIFMTCLQIRMLSWLPQLIWGWLPIENIFYVHKMVIFKCNQHGVLSLQPRCWSR